MKNNIFLKETVAELTNRINNLTPQMRANWGKMNISQMLAHCNVTYEMVYDNIHSKPNFILKFILKTIVKPKVVSDQAYSKNGKTAPQFIITESKDFEREKKRLIDYIIKTEELGEKYFDGKESHSFGKLTTKEWNILFYKHINHHLNQFGV